MSHAIPISGLERSPAERGLLNAVVVGLTVTRTRERHSGCGKIP